MNLNESKNNESLFYDINNLNISCFSEENKDFKKTDFEF
jgi:hypothetical protein